MAVAGSLDILDVFAGLDCHCWGIPIGHRQLSNESADRDASERNFVHECLGRAGRESKRSENRRSFQTEFDKYLQDVCSDPKHILGASI